MGLQVILGSGGTISKELSKHLTVYTDQIRQVSRNPQAFNEKDEVLKADITLGDETMKAVDGADVVYLMVGLEYNLKVWQKSWPIIMQNVLNACEVNHSKLVFLDNIYMYDANYLNPMNEDTPVNPPSKKGEVRAQIAEMLLSAIRDDKIKGLIARSADFYGPAIDGKSMLTETVLKPFSQGKKANWMGSAIFKHSFTYTPDAGQAVALLGNTDDAYNQVWHLPTDKNPLTGKEMMELIAKTMNVKLQYREASMLMVKILGLFIPVMREMKEMFYQYDRDYVFDSHKFNSRFNFTPTTYQQGIENIVKSDYTK